MTTAVGGVVHDMNNLLAGMLVQTSLALTKLPPDSPSRTHIEKVAKAVRRAADLTRDLVAYSEGEPGVCESLNFSQLVQDNVELLRALLSRDVEVELNLEPDSPDLHVDRSRMQHLLMNLLLNATEALPQGKGKITVSINRAARPPAELNGWMVVATGATAPEYLAMEVSDTGAGMAKEALPYIFMPFYTTKRAGRGLGLSSALDIVRAHQGYLLVKSAVGQGAKFRVLLPITPGGAPAVNGSNGPGR